MRTIEISVSLADDELLDAVEAIEGLLEQSEPDLAPSVRELLLALDDGIASRLARRRRRYRRERPLRRATFGL